MQREPIVANQMAPPPPRPLPAQSQQPETDIDMTKVEKKIRNTMVIIIVFVIFFIIIAILSVTIHESDYDGTLEADESEYGFEFTVPGATDSTPVNIEVTSSHKVDYFFILSKDQYEFYQGELDYEIRVDDYKGVAIKTLQDTSRISYEGDLDKGDYVIVAASAERSHNIELEYKITRFIIQPVILFILIIFIIIWVLLGVRVFSLYKKKNEYEEQEELAEEYGDYYTGYGEAPPPPPRPPPTYYQQPPAQGLQAPPSGRVYYPDQEQYPETAEPPPPPPPQPRQRPPPPRSSYPNPPGFSNPPPSNPGNEYVPITINCKCGGTIRVDSPERPVEIRCPDCGRKGVVEATAESSTDEDRYF